MISEADEIERGGGLRLGGAGVRFRRIEFLPARAGLTLEQLRTVLELPEGTPLAVGVPLDFSKPGAISEAAYLDDDLRINRGQGCVAMLRKVH